MSCSGTCSGYSTSKGGGGKGTKRLGWSWNILDVPYFLIFLSNFFHDCFTFELLSSLAEVKLFVRDSKLEDGPRQRGLTFVGLAHGQGLFWLVISCYFNFMLFMYNHVYIYNYIIIYIYTYICYFCRTSLACSCLKLRQCQQPGSLRTARHCNGPLVKR